MIRVMLWVTLVLTFIMLCECQRQTRLYEILEVTEKANSNQIKKAFRRLSIKFHPDRNAGNQQIQKKYVQIKNAYEVLIDVAKRITYDIYGQAGLKELQRNPLRKGGDFRTQMWIPLQKFYTGGQEVYSFRRGQVCKDCADKQIIIAPRDLSFELEKGMKNGDVILFKGQSEQGFDFYPGDVFVKLNQVHNSVFTRADNDLKIKVDISLKEAILGFERNIKHLDGHNVFIEEIDDIQDGKVLEIQNQGMPIRGELDNYGKLKAVININFKKFGEDQLAQIREIFDAATSDQQL